MRIALGVMVLVMAAQLRADWGHSPPDSLVEAHQAYVEGDLLRMSQKLRDVLQKNSDDPYILSNAFALLGKAYEQNHGRLPADWKLPEAVLSMRLSQARRSDGQSFRVRLSGDVTQAGALLQVRLVHANGHVVLDKRGGVGEWRETSTAEGHEYELELDDQTDPMTDGLHLLHLETSAGKAVDGYVIVNDLVATSSPVIRSPAPGETLAAQAVHYLWDDYVSEQRKSYESRALWVSVARSNPPAFAWEEQCGQYFDAPGVTSPAQFHAPTLSPGRYFLHVSFKESRGFGDVKLRRESNSSVVFHVRGE